MTEAASILRTPEDDVAGGATGCVTAAGTGTVTSAGGGTAGAGTVGSAGAVISVKPKGETGTTGVEFKAALSSAAGGGRLSAEYWSSHVYWLSNEKLSPRLLGRGEHSSSLPVLCSTAAKHCLLGKNTAKEI